MLELWTALLDAIHYDADWGVQVFIIIFASLVLSYFAGVFLKRMHKRLIKTKNMWDDAVILALKRPLKLLILVVGFTFAIEIIYKEAEAEIFRAVYPIRDVLIVAAIAWFLLRLIRECEKGFVAHRKVTNQEIDITTLDAVTKLLRISVIITAGLILLQSLGYSISGVLAFGGVGGVAIGFAAKDLLANFFGALMIYFDKPFAVGDWIRSSDREIEGTVENIGWRLTRIRTFDKRPLYVPNAAFTTIAVENPSRMSHRRIFETIGLRYQDISVINNIIAEVTSMLQAHEAIDDSQTLIVNVNKFGSSAIEFFIYTFTHTTNWIEFHEKKQDVLLKIAGIIAENGAEIAFPTQTLHIADSVKIES